MVENTVGPLGIEPILDRIIANVPVLEFVGRTADMEGARRSKTPVSPSAYVILASEQASNRVGTTSRLVQPMTANWSVVTCLRQYTDMEGEAGLNDVLADFVGPVRLALLGWRHPEASTEVEMTGTSGVIAFENGVLWWEDKYTARYELIRTP